MDTFVRQYNSFDVNVMVGVGDGLVAPVVRDVGGRGLKAISDDVRNLAHAAQAEELQPQQVGDVAIQRESALIAFVKRDRLPGRCRCPTGLFSIPPATEAHFLWP